MGPDDIDRRTASLWAKAEESKVRQLLTDVATARSALGTFYEVYDGQSQGWSLINLSGEEDPVGQSVEESTAIREVAQPALTALSILGYQPIFADEISKAVLEDFMKEITAAWVLIDPL